MSPYESMVNATHIAAELACLGIKASYATKAPLTYKVERRTRTAV
jgi:hypothetical protein